MAHHHRHALHCYIGERTACKSILKVRLDLEATGLSATTCPLELQSQCQYVFAQAKQRTNLAALGDGVRLLVLVRAHAEVLDGLTSVPLAAKQDGVGTSGRTERELVKGDGLTAGLEDARLGRLGEAEGSDGQLGDLEEADIVGDGANNNDGLGVTVGGVSSLLEDAGERQRGAVDLGEEEAVEDGLNQTLVSSIIWQRMRV